MKFAQHSHLWWWRERKVGAEVREWCTAYNSENMLFRDVGVFCFSKNLLESWRLWEKGKRKPEDGETRRGE
jgi:hypothetical protein